MRLIAAAVIVLSTCCSSTGAGQRHGAQRTGGGFSVLESWDGELLGRGWEPAPIEWAPVGTHDGAVRIVVLWNVCRGTSADEDARWVREETAKLATCDGVARVAVHQVESAALRHPRAFDWCLELELANREAPNAFVRRAPCSEFLADLRLLGTRPTVFVLPGEAS